MTAEECAGDLGECAAAVEDYRARDSTQEATILQLTAELLQMHSTVEVIFWTVGGVLLGAGLGFVGGILAN